VNELHSTRRSLVSLVFSSRMKSALKTGEIFSSLPRQLLRALAAADKAARPAVEWRLLTTLTKMVRAR
jgi:hypothetical protein